MFAYISLSTISFSLSLSLFLWPQVYTNTFTTAQDSFFLCFLFVNAFSNSDNLSPHQPRYIYFSTHSALHLLSPDKANNSLWVSNFASTISAHSSFLARGPHITFLSAPGYTATSKGRKGKEKEEEEEELENLIIFFRVFPYRLLPPVVNTIWGDLLWESASLKGYAIKTVAFWGAWVA